MPNYRTESIAVAGGKLHVGIWGSRGPVLLCSHGITANHKSFQLLAEELADDFQLVAPDHRGRGKSAAISAPWGMTAHADDMARVLHGLGIERADLMVGHSMGAFVSVVTQARYPELVDRLMLVDGGLPLFDVLPDLSAEQLIDAVIGPAMQRLDMTFASEEAYLDFWREHPAFARRQDWNEALETYLRNDLGGESPSLKSVVNKAAIVADTQSQLMSDDIVDALASLTKPTCFLQAPRGVLDDAPLYPMERLQGMAAQFPDFEYKSIEDVNHYTIALGARGAQAIAQEVYRFLERA